MTRRQKEGIRTSSLAEGKRRTPPGPLGSSPFTVLDPGSPKGGGAEAGEGCHQDGGRNKAWIQTSGGPGVSRPSSPPREPSTQRRTQRHNTGDHPGKLERDRSLVLQLKTDLQHREDAIKKKARARERPVNGASGGRKLQSRQQERDLEEEDRHPELCQKGGAPREGPAPAGGAGQAEADASQDDATERGE